MVSQILLLTLLIFEIKNTFTAANGLFSTKTMCIPDMKDPRPKYHEYLFQLVDVTKYCEIHKIFFIRRRVGMF